MTSILRTFHECFPLDELSEGALEDLRDEMSRMFEVQRFNIIGMLSLHSSLRHMHLLTSLAKPSKNRTDVLNEAVDKLGNASSSELPELLRGLKGSLPKLKR